MEIKDINDNTSSVEIGTLIDELENSLKEQLHARDVVVGQKQALARHIIEHELEKGKLEEPLRKVRYQIEVIRSDLRVARSKFFQARNSGL